ncbi:MAG: caspase family protein [Hyphomicrobiaceae bacterium]
MKHPVFALLLGVFALLALAGLTREATAEARVALVVGNAAYRHTAPLTNPLNDARAMTRALQQAGFDVVEALDADKGKLDAALRSFTEKLTGAEVALFYYAGHGLQVGAQNYLVPVDAQLTRERDLAFEAIRLDFVMRQMEIDREGKTSIVVLDACRDNPLSRNLARSMGTRSASIGRGLAATATGLGTFIAFATQPGNVALDGNAGNSPFTAALVKHMLSRGRNLNATMIAVRNDVVAATDGRQVPWDHSAITQDFYFVPGSAAPSGGTVEAAPAASGEDYAALKQRLARLEAEARARDTAPRQSSPDTRRKMEDLQEEGRKQQIELLEAMRLHGQAQDAADRARIARDLARMRLEIARRSRDIARLNAETEPKAKQGAGAPPPVQAAPDPNASAADFTKDDNVRLDGTEIRSFRAPNPDACRNACADQAGCTGYQHGRKIPVMGTCTLFSKVDARHEDRNWRSGVRSGSRSDAPAATSDKSESSLSLPAKSRTKLGFAFYDKLIVVGDEIKSANTDSPDGCLTVCRNTAGCIAASYSKLTTPHSEVTNLISTLENCVALSSVRGTREGYEYTTAIIRESETAGRK